MIEYVNPAFERLTGYTKEEAIGDTPRILKSGVHEQKVYEELWTTILAGNVFRAEMVNRKKSGELFHAEKTITPIRDEQGRITHFVSTDKEITERKRAEEALKQQKDLYEALLKAQSDLGEGLLITDGQRTRFANDAAYQISGYSAAELIALPSLFELVVPEQRAVLIERFRQRLSGQEMPDRYQTAILHKSGQRISVELAVKLFRADDTARLVITARDITERKRGEEALRESEGRYRTLFENANDGIVTFTLEGTVTSVDRGLEAMLRWPRNELIGQHYRKFVSPAGVSLGEERTRRFLLGERVPSIFEAEMVRKDGSVMQVEARTRPIRDKDGTPIGIQGIYRDITERKLAETVIIEWKNRYEAAVQASSQVLYDRDPYTDKIILGGCVEQLYGCSAEEMPSDLAEMIERIHPDDREAFRQETDRVITTETPFHLKYQMRRKDGSYITIEDQGCFFRDSAGNLVRMVGFLVDITERKRAEEERQQLQRQLFQAQKLESVGTLAGGIAHDFNNILAAILGFTELVADEVPDGTRARRNLEEVLKASRRAKGLVQQLLTFSRPHNQGYRPIHLQPILEEVLTFLRALPTKTIAIQHAINAPLAPVLADPTQMLH